MRTAQKTPAGAERPNLHERATASRASAARVMGSAPQPATCAASKLGEMLEQAWVESDQADENPVLSRVIGPLKYQRIQTLEVAISFARASSPAGMLAQLAVAFTAVDTAANGASPEICSAGQDQAERCLYSIAAALCAMTGVDRAAFMGRYMPMELDALAALSPEAGR